MTDVNSSIFKMYDIRGKVDSSLTEQTVYCVGKALGSEVVKAGGKAIALGRDGRLSGERFRDAIVKGLLETGLRVIDLGLVPTPMVYFAAATLPEVRSCVVITGSHNPPQDNGIKMVIEGVTLYGAYIQTLLQRILNDDYLLQPNGQYETLDIFADYQQRIASDIQIARPLKVVVDAGNGAAGIAGPAVLRAIGCEVIELFCEIDGRFPNHHPDPAKQKNLLDLIAAVKTQQADLGIAFDGDGDRCGVVDNLGQSLYADRQMMLYAKDVLSRQPGAEIIYDIKCSSLLAKEVEAAGGKATMWKTGHSFMKAKMRETGAALGGEVSGHIFWQERWFGFDDGIYTAARMCEILAKQPLSAAELFASLPNAFNTPELEIAFEEGEHYQFMEAFRALAPFQDGKIFALDGIRVDYVDGWGLVRPSNTSPVITLRFEADNLEALERIKARFRYKILLIKPDLVLPF
ncbi:phosphomannomutase/phosphoglucomutase [Thiosulfativibrio zosterae]|uniref:phosphomannomutase n=1 Tax=Thiosulfativibrio zosterae TaxID=2675053 RepID=A0A6F8PKH5_9GAMM|nr:phosphomannomutase/phosphoglucomutase [Thiosulfativibrio zosterae]BBP42557.1 phosphomannomutase/phosphoglucomutase [Thiosulfativibrio zosterae]